MEGTEAAETEAILAARELAAARNDWFVRYSHPGIQVHERGELSEAEARELVDRLRGRYRFVQLLRVVEVYE